MIAARCERESGFFNIGAIKSLTTCSAKYVTGEDSTLELFVSYNTFS